jgi:H+/Cl- antiporter ClcA
MSSQLFSAIAWSVAGFVVGFFTCWACLRAARAERIREDHVKGTKGSRSDVYRAILGVAILLMVIFSGYRYYTATTCQTKYNEAVAEALAQRSEAQRAEGAAQIELLTASLSGDPVRGVQETRDYISAISALERVRAANPLPAPPDCGRF